MLNMITTNLTYERRHTSSLNSTWLQHPTDLCHDFTVTKQTHYTSHSGSSGANRRFSNSLRENFTLARNYVKSISE